jgi:hypothetical protein
MMEMHPKTLGAHVVHRLMDKLRAAGFSITDVIGDCTHWHSRRLARIS